MGFGSWKASTLPRKFSMSLKSVNGFVEYSRGGKKVNVMGDLKQVESDLRILPRSPINLPERITDHYMINFPLTIIPPGGRQVIFIRLPLEVEVRYKGRALDFVGFDSPSFSLYGPVDGGILTRNIRGEIVTDSSGNPPKNMDGRHMVMPLRIKNYTSQLHQINKVLINTRYMDLYYKGLQVATEKIKMDLTAKGVHVRYLNETHFKGLQKMSGESQLLKKEQKTDMEWGL